MTARVVPPLPPEALLTAEEFLTLPDPATGRWSCTTGGWLRWPPPPRHSVVQRLASGAVLDLVRGARGLASPLPELTCRLSTGPGGRPGRGLRARPGPAARRRSQAGPWRGRPTWRWRWSAPTTPPGGCGRRCSGTWTRGAPWCGWSTRSGARPRSTAPAPAVAPPGERRRAGRGGRPARLPAAPGRPLGRPRAAVSAGRAVSILLDKRHRSLWTPPAGRSRPRPAARIDGPRRGAYAGGGHAHDRPRGPPRRHGDLPVHRPGGQHRAAGRPTRPPTGTPCAATTPCSGRRWRPTGGRCSRRWGTRSTPPSPAHRRRRGGPGGPARAQAEAWGATGPLRVRMGVHLGEVERQGAHYFGAPLYRCARLHGHRARGPGGALRGRVALVRDALPEGAGLRDLGEHRLKDLQRPERVFQLAAPGAARRLPRPAHPGRAPQQPAGAADQLRRPGAGAGRAWRPPARAVPPGATRLSRVAGARLRLGPSPMWVCNGSGPGAPGTPAGVPGAPGPAGPGSASN